MTGRWLLPAGDTGKPTWTVHTSGTPLAEICLGSGFAPVVDFTDPADIDALIWALAKARDALADAQASAQETSLPGLGAQGEPATGGQLTMVNTGQGHNGEPVLDPDCRDGKHTSCAGGPCECECDCHLPPLPQRVPAGPPEHQTPYYTTCCDDVPPGYLHSHVHDQDCANPPMCHGCVPRDEPDEKPIIISRDELLSDWRAAHPDECSCPSGRVDPSCPQHGEPQPGGTIYPELTEEALAGEKPLVSLAPEPQEGEAQA